NMAGGDGGAGNSLRVSGSDLDAPGGIGAGTEVTDLYETSARAGFALQNSQFSDAVLNAGVIYSQTGVFTDMAFDGSFSVTGNSVGAEVRDNYASNAIALDGFSSLASTAALQSAQVSLSSLTAEAGNVEVGIETDDVLSDVTGTVSGNAIAAKAVANTAGNLLAVDAANLSGNGVNLLPDVSEYRGAATQSGS